MKRPILLLSLVIVVIISVIITIISANANDGPRTDISAGFDAIKEKIKKVSNKDTAVAKVNGISISQEDFTFYKYNIELTFPLKKKFGQVDEQASVPSDELLIENMITNKLTIQEAKRRGITVSESEVDDVITREREVIDTLVPSNEGEQIVLELMKNRIRITGLTDDAFWSSDFTRDHYRDALYGGKLAGMMLDNQDVGSFEEFYQYKKELYNDIQDQIQYNKKVLEAINNL